MWRCIIGDRRCCCEVICWQYLDDFNDANTTTPANWYEETGDWGISGLVLVEDYSTGVDGTDAAKLVCTEQQPIYHAGEQYLSIWVYRPAEGDKYYLYPCAASATSTETSLEVEFECTTAPSGWTVRVGSGADEETATFAYVTENGAGFVLIGACVDGQSGMVLAWVGQGAEPPLWNDHITPETGRYSGIGHDNAGRLNAFDDYEVGELRDRNDYTCFPCFCHCRDHYLKKELNLRIYNATGRADCMDGKSGTMVYDWNAGNDRWEVTLTGDNHDPTDGNGGTWDRTFYLYCEGEDIEQVPGYNFTLTHDPFGSCCNLGGTEACDTSRPSYAECTSGALNLTFGPFGWTYTELTCATCYDPGLGTPATRPESGQYYVVITD